MAGRVVAVAGLAFEARIAAGPDVEAICGDDGFLRRRLEELAPRVSAVVSFGIAGGLDPRLPPGTLVIGEAVVEERVRWRTDRAWSAHLRDRLPGARWGPVAAVTAPVGSPAAKAELRGHTQAVAADMESGIAARFAAAHGLPFAVLRAVADPAGRSLPAAALAGQRPDGRTDAFAVLRALARAPGELSALIAVAIDADRARRALLRGRRALGPGLGFLDLGELPLDVA